MGTVIRRVDPVGVPFVVQARLGILIGRADHGHMPVPAVIVLGSFIARVA